MKKLFLCSCVPILLFSCSSGSKFSKLEIIQKITLPERINDIKLSPDGTKLLIVDFPNLNRFIYDINTFSLSLKVFSSDLLSDNNTNIWSKDSKSILVNAKSGGVILENIDDNATQSSPSDKILTYFETNFDNSTIIGSYNTYSLGGFSSDLRTSYWEAKTASFITYFKSSSSVNTYSTQIRNQASYLTNFQDGKILVLIEGGQANNFSPDGKTWYVCKDEELLTFDALTGVKKTALKIPRGCGYLEFNQSNTLFAKSTGVSLELINLATGERVWSADKSVFKFGEGYIIQMAFTPDGKYLITSFSSKKEIYFWGVKAQSAIFK